MSGIRRAAERLSLRSESNTIIHAERNVRKHSEDGTEAEWDDSYPRHQVQRDSATTIAQIPLVHLGSKDSKTTQVNGHVRGDYLEPTDLENGKVLGGLDAV